MANPYPTQAIIATQPSRGTVSDHTRIHPANGGRVRSYNRGPDKKPPAGVAPVGGSLARRMIQSDGAETARRVQPTKSRQAK
jgi:hypothetical protein